MNHEEHNDESAFIQYQHKALGVVADLKPSDRWILFTQSEVDSTHIANKSIQRLNGNCILALLLSLKEDLGSDFVKLLLSLNEVVLAELEPANPDVKILMALNVMMLQNIAASEPCLEPELTDFPEYIED